MKYLNSISISAVLILIVMIAMTLPIMASTDATNIRLTVTPTTVPKDSFILHKGTIEILNSTENYYAINATIPGDPQGYTLSLPSKKGASVGTFKMTYLNKPGKTVIIKIIKNSSTTVDVNYSKNNGNSWNQVFNQNINYMTIGSTNLKFTGPGQGGYLNITLGGIGPAKKGDTLSIEMATGTIKSPPGNKKDLIWKVDARYGSGGKQIHSDTSKVTTTN